MSQQIESSNKNLILCLWLGINIHRKCLDYTKKKVSGCYLSHIFKSKICKYWCEVTNYMQCFVKFQVFLLVALNENKHTTYQAGRNNQN